jgi:hypothetical protein
VSDEERRIAEIRSRFRERGWELLGPHQPGADREDLTAEERERIGWGGALHPCEQPRGFGCVRMGADSTGSR